RKRFTQKELTNLSPERPHLNPLPPQPLTPKKGASTDEHSQQRAWTRHAGSKLTAPIHLRHLMMMLPRKK
ncbi:Hypothetical predicted protein, partial [Marmota monax]